MKFKLITVASSLFLFLLILNQPNKADEAASKSLITSTISTVETTNEGYKLQSPDWRKITWGNLPSIQQPGYIEIPEGFELEEVFEYDPSRSWIAGQSVDSIIKLGDIEDAFEIGRLSLKKIATIIPVQNDSSVTIKNSKLTLEDFGIIKWQTLESLVKAIPELEDMAVEEIKPIKDFLEELNVSSTGSIAQIVESNPEIAEIPLGQELDLSQYSIDSIPELDTTQIAKFKKWRGAFINQVPGLSQVPFSEILQPISEGVNVVGVASLPLGTAEHGDSRVGKEYYISGSVNKEGVTVPVACETGEECAYLEMGDLVGSGGGLWGKRWVSGSSQQVKGGFGLLASVNDGKEPTGRLVFGPAFKVVLTSVNESKGSADFALFFRFCATIPFGGRTCTPYFIGPVPWIPVREKDLVIVGTGR